MADTEPTTEPAPAAVRVQILATEHWSLLATRQLAWTEAFTRAGLFLTVLSAAVVALALIEQTDRDFTLFALVLLPVVLLLGLATFFRLAEINDEDEWLLVGMNRLRRGYLDIAPELEPYFVTSGRDDRAGLLITRGIDMMTRMPLPLQVMMSTPVVIGVVDAVLFGVIGGIAAGAGGLSTGPAVGVAVLAGLLLAGLLALVPTRQLLGWKTYRPRFPRPVHASAPASGSSGAGASRTGRGNPPASGSSGAGARPGQGGEPSEGMEALRHDPDS